MTITETLIKEFREEFVDTDKDKEAIVGVWDKKLGYLTYMAEDLESWLKEAFEKVEKAAYEAGKKSQTAFIYEIRKERLRKGICASCKSPVSLENKRLCKYHRNKFLEYKKNYNLQKRLEKLLHPQEKKK